METISSHKSPFYDLNSEKYQLGLILPSEPPYEPLEIELVSIRFISNDQQLQNTSFMFNLPNEPKQAQLGSNQDQLFIYLQQSKQDQHQIDQEYSQSNGEVLCHPIERISIENQIQETPNTNPTSNLQRQEARTDNNDYKKMTTQLNEILKDINPERLKEIKKKCPNFPKGSKYAFTMRLMQIQKYGKRNLLYRIKQQFDKNLDQKYSTGNLQKLAPYYKESFSLYLTESLQQSLKCIYEIDNFKETTYRDRALKRILDYKLELGL